MEILLKTAQMVTNTNNIFGIFRNILGILFAICVFGFLIFIHELGHFVVAKKSGIKVNEFAIGMGPVLFKLEKGETTYALRLLPIGGFVAMEGEDDDSNDSRSFKNAKISKRVLVMVAGATMNIILGFVLIISLSYYRASAPDFLFPTTTIAAFHQDATTNQWLEQGDKILAINNKKVKNYTDMSFYMSRDNDGFIDILVSRNNDDLLLKNVEFQRSEVAEDLYQNVLDFIPMGVPATFGNTFLQSIIMTKDLIRQIWSSLGDLLTGNVSIKHMSGPIGITKEIGAVSSTGNWSYTILFIALISLNLGVLNLLPLPILDGGKLFLLLIEAIRGKALNEKYEMYINLVGFVLMFLLMIIVSLNDILNLV